MKRSIVAAALCQFLASTLFVCVAHAQSSKFLDAPVVRSEIPVQWDSQGKSLQWLKNGQPIEFRADDLFLAKGPLNITYPFMNPLRIRGTASATATADPSVAIMSKLVEAVTSIIETVAPVPPAVAPGAVARGLSALRMSTGKLNLSSCETTDIEEIRRSIWDATYDKKSLFMDQKTLGFHVSLWISTIDSGLQVKPGYLAVGDTVELIKADISAVGNRIDNIDQLFTFIHECASMDGLESRPMYIDFDLNQYQARIAAEKLRTLRTAMTQLKKELEDTYMVSSNWVELGKKAFKLNSSAVTATNEKMQKVAIKISSIEIKADDDTIAVSKQDAGAAEFVIRRYALLTPEIGTGVVFSSLKKPTYGTGENSAGDTIVTKSPDTSLSVSPSLMVNFVCRCHAGPLVPMVQIGAAVSRDLPALLFGAGIRLFGLGSGDISISGGVMAAWLKDLQKLNVGDVVTGMTDINSDLGYSGKPKTKAYFGILYKFSQ